MRDAACAAAAMSNTGMYVERVPRRRSECLARRREAQAMRQDDSSPVRVVVRFRLFKGAYLGHPKMDRTTNYSTSELKEHITISDAI